MRGLATTLPVFAVTIGLKLESGSSAEFVDVAAREAGAISAVPIFFEKHGTLAARTAARGSSLH